METIARFLFEGEKSFYAFLVLIVFAVFINRRNSKEKKRWTKKGLFFFFLATTFFLFYCSAAFTLKGDIPFELFPFLILVSLAFGIFFCKRNWAFKTVCVSCGERLDLTSILMEEKNLCPACLKNTEEK